MNDKPKKGEFVNDLLRSEFHKKFMFKWVSERLSPGQADVKVYQVIPREGGSSHLCTSDQQQHCQALPYASYPPNAAL